MAATSAIAGKAGFRFSKGAVGGVCGWLFLARMSPVLHEAQTERQILAGEDWSKQTPRSTCRSTVAGRRLERMPYLGVPVEETRGDYSENPENAGLKRFPRDSWFSAKAPIRGRALPSSRRLNENHVLWTWIIYSSN